MAAIFDCALSSLLCAEDNSSIFDDGDDSGSLGEDGVEISSGPSLHNRRQERLSLSIQTDECLGLMLERELEHLPRPDYLKRLRTGDLDLAARKEAVDWIFKVQSHYNFGPLSTYLSVNYLDRFLSAYEFPKSKCWMVELVAVACLTLAVKVDETDVPLCVDLQAGHSKLMFEAETVQRMELLVLSTLKWRMQSVTPFSFLDYFLHKLNSDRIHQSIYLFLRIIRGIEFLEFRPSEIAAAVAVSVTGGSSNAIALLSDNVEKERLVKCLELIRDLPLMVEVPSVPQSPIAVLDAAACLSFKSDETPTGSCQSSPSPSLAAPKRRKLNCFTCEWGVEFI